MSDEFDDAEDEEEFDEGEGEGEEGDESSPKSGFGLKKLLLFVILPLVVLLGGGIGAVRGSADFDSVQKFAQILRQALGLSKQHEMPGRVEHQLAVRRDAMVLAGGCHRDQEVGLSVQNQNRHVESAELGA